MKVIFVTKFEKSIWTLEIIICCHNGFYFLLSKYFFILINWHFDNGVRNPWIFLTVYSLMIGKCRAIIYYCEWHIADLLLFIIILFRLLPSGRRNSNGIEYFSIFPGNGDSAGVEPEKVGYLGMGLSDIESKTRFGNMDKFYIDHQKTSVWNWNKILV